jgi:mannose-6-phosphate isomerase-like protein (cupin superfamily)
VTSITYKIIPIPAIGTPDDLIDRPRIPHSMGPTDCSIDEQILQSGTGVQDHWHYYEEHVTIFSGDAEVQVGDEIMVTEEPATLIVPLRSHHGFTNVGDGPLWIIGVVNWPILEAGIVGDPAAF